MTDPLSPPHSPHHVATPQRAWVKREHGHHPSGWWQSGLPLAGGLCRAPACVGCPQQPRRRAGEAAHTMHACGCQSVSKSRAKQCYQKRSCGSHLGCHTASAAVQAAAATFGPTEAQPAPQGP